MPAVEYAPSNQHQQFVAQYLGLMRADSVDDLALNQATEKGNILRRAQQVHEAAACMLRAVLASLSRSQLF
jgi:hypothetical protein